MSGGPAPGHRVALFTSLRSHQIAELVGTRQEDPPIIVAKQGQLEQLSEEVVKQVEEARGDPSRPSFFYEPDLDLDSSLDSETGSPRLCRRSGVGGFKVKEVVAEKEAMESELGRRLLERARSAPAEHAPLGVHKTDATKLLAMSVDSQTWAELAKTIEELEAEEPSQEEEPASSTTVEETVSITLKNAQNIFLLLQRCKEEGGSLAERAGKAEPVLEGVVEAQTEEVLVRGREIEVLQQLGNAYMLALADRMRGATRSEAFKLNRKIVWAGCVLDAFIPVIESQSKPLTEEEERILAAGGSTPEPGALRTLRKPTRISDGTFMMVVYVSQPPVPGTLSAGAVGPHVGCGRIDGKHVGCGRIDGKRVGCGPKRRGPIDDERVR